MVSAQIPGVLKFYRITPTGSKVFVYGADIKALGPSGSVDGVIASTPEKWIHIPLQNAPNKVLQVNDKLHVTYTPAAAATTDATDAAWAIPITYQDFSSDTLGGPSDASVWDVFVLGDVALIASREYPICEKVIRMPFALGSNVQPAFASIENNS